MEGLTTDSGLAFALEGDPRIYNTTRQIARVPLGDYVLDNDEHMTLARLANDATMLTLDGAASHGETNVRTLSAQLLAWQEQQTVPQHIDKRFRFRLLLQWLREGHRITNIAADFMQQHARAQYEVLHVEMLSMQEIGQVRQEEGLTLSEVQEKRVEELDLEMKEVVAALHRVRELLHVAVAAGLVEGAVQILELVPEANREPAAAEHEMQSDAIVDMDWRIDTSFDGL